MKLSSTGDEERQGKSPIEVDQRLDPKDGDRAKFAAEENQTAVQPAPPGEDVFAKWVGAFPYFKSLEEINAYYRELRGYDDDE